MITIAKQQWNDRFKKLPLPIRAVLMDPDNQLADRVNTLCQRHELDDTQIATITRLTAHLLMGFILPTEFVRKIVEDIGVPRDKAILITQDLNRDVFNELKDFLKDVHSENTEREPTVAKPEKPASIPSAALPAVGPTLPPSPTGPIRSDWGWHGAINKTTGQIEYKRETGVPETLVKKPSQTSTEGPTHVGSIFEQKLGGAFRMKGETVQYEVYPVVPPSGTPRADTTGATPPQAVQGGTDRVQGGTPVPSADGATGQALRIAPQSPDTRFDLNPALRGPRSNLVSGVKPVLRVPHKPTEVKIPPAQATQPPKTRE